MTPRPPDPRCPPCPLCWTGAGPWKAWRGCLGLFGVVGFISFIQNPWSQGISRLVGGWPKNPLKNDGLRHIGMIIPNIWKNKKVPNHQPKDVYTEIGDECHHPRSGDTGHWSWVIVSTETIWDSHADLEENLVHVFGSTLYSSHLVNHPWHQHKQFCGQVTLPVHIYPHCYPTLHKYSHQTSITSFHDNYIHI